MVNGRIGCDMKDAMSFMGIGRDRFTKLKRDGIIKEAGINWFLYCDLVEAAESVRAKRDNGEVIEIEEGRQARSEVHRPGYRTPPIYLQPDQPGGRRRTGAKAGDAQR